MFNPPWQFKKRTRRPPKDPINAVLSFGYVILGSEIQAFLDGIGFDPYLGFYHVTHYGRPSLSLDLLEEFRHRVIDRIALRLFNLGRMKKEEDFYQPRSGGVYLSTEGKRKFFEEYEKMAGSRNGATDGQIAEKGFRKEIRERIYELAKMLNNGYSMKEMQNMGPEDFDE